jgi:2-desacetyl-2-hydroxyethyl bacteriochlorophyllide A dehydrogenase
MKAIIATKSGPPEVLQLREVPIPQPTDHEILVKVHAATVTRGDVVLRKMHPFLFILLSPLGLKRKVTPGHEFAGKVVEVGSSVRRFKVGDAIFGTTSGLRVGANAEYLCLPEETRSNVLAIKPANIPFGEAAALPVGALTALYLLQKAKLQAGQKVLVYGASGSVGTYATQLTKAYFDAWVAGVCSTKNVNLVKSLGADAVIDYTQQDFTQNGRQYDVIFDAVGKLSADQCKSSLAPGGLFVSVRSMTREDPGKLKLLTTLLAEVKIKAVIDKRYPLEQVAEAHRYVESGHKCGNVVISIIND